MILPVPDTEDEEEDKLEDVEKALAAWKADLEQEDGITDFSASFQTVFREADLIRQALGVCIDEIFPLLLSEPAV